MVSYFVPRGRYFVHNFRQAQKQWPMLHHFYQTFASSSKKISKATTHAPETSNILVKRTASTAKKHLTTQIENTSINTQQQKQQHKQSKLDTLREDGQGNQQKRQRKSWLHWTGLLLRLAPVGIFMFSAIEWQWHKYKCIKNQVPRRASEFQMKMYCSLPLRIISRCWGWLASCYLPTMLRPFIYGCYSSAFNVNMEEAMYPDYKYYNSLSEFFTRPLRNGVRPIDQLAILISPADGRVLHFGTVSQNSLIEQVKGVNYSLEDFLGPASFKSTKTAEKETIEFVHAIKEHNDNETQLYQCVIYLAPGDYHRFHSPALWLPKLRRHFSGELLSVNPRVASWMPGLFCLNERALYMGNWEYGFFSYTAVGATNVGSVQIFMDEKLKTNCWLGLNIGTHKKKHNQYDEIFMNNEKNLEKGELLGQFNMGSTIVLIFEAPKNFIFDIEAGQQVLVGQALGHIN